MSTALREKEQNGLRFVCCPNCSRMYPRADEKGQANELPSRCKRCGSPMDPEKALAFADKQAEGEHQPTLAALGEAARGKR